MNGLSGSGSAELWELSATEVLGGIKRDELTVETYAKALLSRIDLRERDVKAWKFLDRDTVLIQARALDQVPRKQRGPLHGVAIAVKDTIDTKDMPTEYGSDLYKHHRPNVDASVVAIARMAGALIIGKTTTTEFSVKNSGPQTVNPHCRIRTPGGSSTGSAVAVADFHVPLSLGTQTSGGVIRPASFTGIFAMKPTFNTIPNGGIKVLAVELDTVGYFARCLEDLELLTDALSIASTKPAWTLPLKQCRVGLVKSPSYPFAGPGTAAAMQNAARILRNHGVMVEDVDFPIGFTEYRFLKEMHETIVEANVGVGLFKDYLMDYTKTKLDPSTLRLVEKGRRMNLQQFHKSVDGFAMMRTGVDRYMTNGYSALITPSAPDEAALGWHDMGSSVFNFAWTAAHLPVIQVPAFVGPKEMPVGLSLVGSRFCDQYLLAISKVLSRPLMEEGGWQEKLFRPQTGPVPGV